MCCRSWTGAGSRHFRLSLATRSRATGTARWPSCHVTTNHRHNTVAEVVAIGFTERDTGRVRRPVQARFYQYPGGQDGGSPSHEEDGGSPGRDAAQAQ